MGKFLFVAVLLVLGAIRSMAQTGNPGAMSSAENQQIRQEMQLLQERLNQLTTRLDQALSATSVSPSPTASSGVPAASSTTSSADAVSLYGVAGTQTPAPGVRTGAGNFSNLRIGGYASFRYEANDINSGPRIGSLPPVQRGVNGFDFRRFVMTLDAAPSPRLHFYSEIEYERFNELEVERTAIPENRGTRDRAGVRFIQEVEGQDGSEIAMEQAWAQYDFSASRPGLAGLRMGVVLPPVGRFNMRHDDDYWDLPRRPLVDRGGPVLPVKSAWRELGAGLVGTIPLGRAQLDYQAYVLGGVKLDFSIEEVVSLRQGRNLLEMEPEISFASGPFNGTDAADAFSWRLGLRPALRSEFALSGYHGKYTPGYLNVSSSIHSLGLDGKTGWNGFEMEGEVVYTDFGRMQAVLSDIARQAVNSAAETSSAESVALETEVAGGFAGPFTNQRYGYWLDFKYRFWPRWLSNTFLGQGFENPQLIPVLRLERIWFNDFLREFTFSQGLITALNTEDQEQQRITFGLTYRPVPNVAMTGAYERNQRIQGTTMIFPRVSGLGGLPEMTYHSLLLGMSVGF